MGEKYYKPILKDGDHLVRSSKNPSRVRGQSRDADNKNPDIVEWEEVEIEDNTSDYEPTPYEERQVQLSPEEERIAQAIGEALGAAIVAGAVWLIDNKVTPWWKRTAWPWIKEKGNDAITYFKGKEKSRAKLPSPKANEIPTELVSVSTQIDETFERFYIEMDEKEAKQHILKILFHMLEIANEIRIMSNAQIKRNDESDEEYSRRIDASEQYLTDKVASNLDRILSNKELQLDAKTSKELFGLFGGGVTMNGEYIPVESKKVYEAILAQNE